MASCESDNFRSTPESQLVRSCLTEYPMIPTVPKTGFAFQISGVPDHYPTTALTIIDQDHNFSLFSFVKEPEPASYGLFSSSGRGPSSAPNSIASMSRSDVKKNTQHLQQSTQMPTNGTTQISYGSPKKLTNAGGSAPEPNSPSLRSPRYYSPALTKVPASNREGLGGFQSPDYSYDSHLTYSGPGHPFHSTPTSSSGSGDFHSTISLESNSQLSHHGHYQQLQDRRHRGSELYAQQSAVKPQLEPVKIECPHVMSSSAWVYPTTHQMSSAPHQMKYYQDTTSGIMPQPQLPPQSPDIATTAVHLALNSQNGMLPDHASSRGHSPGTYTFQGPPASASTIHSDHNSIYTGGGVTAPPTPTFPDTHSGPTQASEPRHLLNESSFTGPLGPSSIHLDYPGVYNVGRAQDVQLLHCSQCPQRFATHEQFAKHQIKHQKLHRCRISGCSRVEGFTTPNDRDRHEKSVHKTPGMYFRCMDESCASYMKTFARRDNLKDHLKRMHKMPQDMDDMEANERRNVLADSWRVDLTPRLTPPPSM